MSKLSLILEPSGNKVKVSSLFQKDADDQVVALGRYLICLLNRDDGVIMEKGKELYSEPPPPKIIYREATKVETPMPASKPPKAKPKPKAKKKVTKKKVTKKKRK